MNLFALGLFTAGGVLVGSAEAAPLEESYAWAAPTPAAQLIGDDSAIPVGKGAVFVPALSKTTSGTEVLIVDGDRVSAGPTGKRILLAPGAYMILVGSGAPDQRAGVEVIVNEGRTTVLPVAWGGLRIEVVNRRLRSRPSDYELIRVATGKTVSQPAELGDGGPPETWLLQPGLYRLQEVGSRGVVSPLFATVYVPASGLVNFRLFVNQTGAVLGGGVISRDEVLDDPASKNWRPTLVVGIDAAGSQTRSIAGFPDLTIGDASAFANFEIGYADDRNLIDLGLEAEYGLMLVQPGTGKALPLLKTRDRLEASANYTFLLNEGVGIYASGQTRTQLTETTAVAAEDTAVDFRNLDGTVERKNIQAATTYTLADAGSPLLLGAGVGLRARLSTARDFDVSFHGGLGYRMMAFNGAYVPTDNPDTQALEFTEVANFSHPGAEGGISAALRLTGTLQYKTSLDAFAAFNDSADVGVWWDNDVNLRVTRALSVSYRLNASRMPWVTEQIAVRQGLYLRLALNVL